MGELSHFSSREAKLSCTDEEFYRFITDLRNFGKLVPGKSVEGWQADANSCRFSVNPMGEITLRIASKIPYSSVIFSGTVLVTTAFDLAVSVRTAENGKGAVKLRMDADLGPMLKMMASGPIERFLEMLVDEMENFRDWDRVSEL
jgi:carbon monoxide dehydrogenase subunit G